MDSERERRLNEAACRVLGWNPLLADDDFVREWIDDVLQEHPLFTRDDNMARLLREEVKARRCHVEFLCELAEIIQRDRGHYSGVSEWDKMQATPLQQVEAALRALGECPD